jgi:hypothetical protein
MWQQLEVAISSIAAALALDAAEERPRLECRYCRHAYEQAADGISRCRHDDACPYRTTVHRYLQARWAMTLAAGDLKFPRLVPAVADLVVEMGSAAKHLRDHPAGSADVALADELDACVRRLRAVAIRPPAA